LLVSYSNDRARKDEYNREKGIRRLEMAKTVVTIQIRLPKSKQTVSKVMLMKRHQKIIALLFDENFWVTR